MLRLEWSGDITIFGSSPSKFLANEYFELKNLFRNFSFSSVMYFADTVLKAVASDDEIFC